MILQQDRKGVGPQLTQRRLPLDLSPACDTSVSPFVRRMRNLTLGLRKSLKKCELQQIRAEAARPPPPGWEDREGSSRRKEEDQTTGVSVKASTCPWPDPLHKGSFDGLMLQLVMNIADNIFTRR